MPGPRKKSSLVKITLGKLGKDWYHLFLAVYVNGKKCRFLIDTGASKSVIDKTYFENHIGKEMLKTLSQETTGLHSSVAESHFGEIRELKIGNHKIADYSLAAIDLTHVNGAYQKFRKPKIQGILGSDLMLSYKMIVDYGKLTVLLP